VRTSVADRSTEQVELVRLAGGGSVAPSKRWTFPIAPGSAGDLDLAARGPRLYLAFSEELIHVFVFDWSKL
jgi:hypothetical protein